MNGFDCKKPINCIEPNQQPDTINNSSSVRHPIDIVVNGGTIDKQISALKHLENSEDPEILASIMGSFNNSFWKLRLAMVPVIAQKGGEKGLKFLSEHLDDSHSQVREEICRIFKDYGNSSHNHILEELMLDSSKDVISAAKIAIQESGTREPQATICKDNGHPYLKKFDAIRLGSK